MGAGIENFQHWLLDYPNVSFLQDEPITIAGVNFFGGTMWTDFAGGNQDAMAAAQNYMNDYRIIHSKEGAVFTPEDSVALHQRFVDNLSRWFEDNLSGKRIVISHHAPVLKQGSIYAESPLVPAFTSLDMVPLIERYKPDLWIYGHTHECDRQRVGGTDILSNQLGYRNGLGGFECVDFDKFGKLSEIV
jgi:predicted phosphohydrolase